jgi:outer membrane receptor protein involved in Fe transport
MKKILFTLCTYLSLLPAFAQTNTLKGKVSTEEGETLPGISIVVKGTKTGTVSDDNGNFKLVLEQSLPVTLVFTYLRLQLSEIQVTNWNDVHAKLPAKAFAQELTGAYVKTPTKLISSPITIERMGLKYMQSLAATTPFDGIANLKGVDMVTSSLTFKTATTRGFNGSGNARVNQLVDGMDNQAPGMNFSIGNFAGITDLDLESIELLAGASSALYGPGGVSGTILINSKNPFKYPGLSIQVKEGMMNVDKHQRPGVTGFHDWAIRYAKVINNKFAFKMGAQYIKATDWLANDSTNYARPNGHVIAGTRNSDPNYDGVNVYGDETTVDIANFLPMPFPSTNVSRTGYDEKDIIDPITKNLKLFAAVHYKLTRKTEAILSGNFGTGTTVYTGTDRYALKNVKIGQYKVELRNTNWFVRAYTTQEDAGDSYAATTIARQFNERWKPSASWYGVYLTEYFSQLGNLQDNITSHNLARAAADKGRPVPGSDQFNKIMDELKTIPISKGGGLFLDKSNLYMAEAQYNLNKAIPFVEIIVGGNYKKYVLNSQGTLFIDTLGKIGVSEVGGYVQASKKLLNERLTLAASGRIDKNQNFAGKITPRFSALIKVAEDNNIRISYQTAYRFPTTQQQYIKIQLADHAWLLGGLPWIQDFMQLADKPVFDATTMEPYKYKELKPETSNSYEVGYKGLINHKLLIDAYAYTSEFKNFLGRVTLYQPSTQNAYVIVTNSDTKVKTRGFGLGLNYLMNEKFTASANFYSDKISNAPDGFVASYNTPEYRMNLGFSGNNLGKQKKFGFGIQYKWQDKFVFENDFATGDVNAFSALDAQVNYKLLKNKFEVRIGGTNLLNHYYKNAFGNPEIGGLYYASLKLDIF